MTIPVAWPASWPRTRRTTRAYMQLTQRALGDACDAWRILVARVTEIIGDDPTEDQIVAIAATLPDFGVREERRLHAFVNECRAAGPLRAARPLLDAAVGRCAPDRAWHGWGTAERAVVRKLVALGRDVTIESITEIANALTRDDLDFENDQYHRLVRSPGGEKG